jgi:hypothetical protein
VVATPAGGRSTSGTESRTSPICFFDLANSQIDGTTALPEGKVNLKTEYSAAGPMDQGGTLRLFVNGKPAGEGKSHWRLSGKSGGNGFALELDPGRRAAYRRSVRTLVILLATAGGVGYVPIASGTRRSDPVRRWRTRRSSRSSLRSPSGRRGEPRLYSAARITPAS